MSASDPYAEVRAEFANGLDARVVAMREALTQLQEGFQVGPADRLHRLAHSLVGTAASFEAEKLAEAAQPLEVMLEGWRARSDCTPVEREAAAHAVTRVAQATGDYVDALNAKPVESAVARLAVVGELAHLINASYDLAEIFRRAIVLVRSVLDFRRASVVLVDETRGHYALHTLYDALRGGFITRDLTFPLHQGLTGEVIRTGRPIRAEDVEGREGILAQAGQRVSAMLVPLRLNGAVIGTLNFGHETPDRYTDDDLEWAGVLARQIEMSLHFSTLLNTIARQGEALARERNQLEALIGASDAAVMLVRPDYTVAYANTEMTRLVGIPGESVVGTSVARLHQFLAASLDDPGALAAQVDALKGGGLLKDRVELLHPERAVYQRVVAPVRDATDGLIGYLLQYRDVTREAELERMKSEFVSVVSHELRTPMTSIKTSLALVLAGAAGALEQSAQELLEIAARNADRLIVLVNDLLDLSQIEAGHVRLKPEPVMLRDAIVASVEMVGAFAAERGVALAIRPSEPQIQVTAVRDRLIQVMVNLLSNAVKFSPRDTRVQVQWWHENRVATIEVSDQGLGIPPDKIESVFEPFTQLAAAITRDQGGAGLGLTISRGIVQALGGRIWAESEPGNGSRFYVSLPLSGAAVSDRSAGPALTSRQDATVLVIHSDPDWQRLCSTAFGAEGWRVVPARSGAEGLTYLRDARADLVVIGLELSDTHGLAVVEQLRGEPRNCDVPALMVGDGDVAHVLDYGADGWSSGESVELVETARVLLNEPLRPVVLFVEDDPAVRDSIRRALRRSGYACLIASEPRQALDLLHLRRPALVITDIRMPEMDGLSFLRTIRADPSLQELPALVLSGYVAPGIPDQVAALSANLLRKPVDLVELLAEVRKLVRAVPAP